MCSKKTLLYLVTQSEAGGAQQYIFDLAAGLKQEFNIIVAFGEQGEKGELAARLQVEEIKFYAIKHLKRNISPINDFLALIEIIKLIKKLKPDIIHLNSSKISILGSTAKLFLKITTFNSKFKIQNSKFIYTVHGWVFNEPLPFWKKKFYFYAEKLTARFKDAIICIDKFDFEIALNALKIPPAKLALIHHGIKAIKFLTKNKAQQKFLAGRINRAAVLCGETAAGQISNSLSNRAAVLCGETAAGQKLLPFISKTEHRQPNTDNRTPTTEHQIVSIGNLYKTKSYETFIEAIYILINSYKLSITGIIIGEGEERKYLEDLIAQLNLKNNFILAGRIDNAAELLPAFDIFVLPSVKEGLPYTILEAMQAGLPIVSTNVGGIPEMIEDGKTGLLIEPKNPQILAEKIYHLLSNPEFAKQLGENAKLKIASEFSLEAMINKTKEIYK